MRASEICNPKITLGIPVFCGHILVIQNQTVMKAGACHVPVKEKEKLDTNSQEQVAISWSLVLTSPVHSATCFENATGGEVSPRGFTWPQRHLNITLNGRKEAEDVFPDRHKDHERPPEKDKTMGHVRQTTEVLTYRGGGFAENNIFYASTTIYATIIALNNLQCI